jgi:tRNA-Thr(GGU) m(6)t(6)A37 methyltransferase TsaA
MTTPDEPIVLRTIGRIRSALVSRSEAPKQGEEGAPDAWLEMEESAAPGLLGIATGDRLVVVTWLHEASRSPLRVHPRDDPDRPLRGVFATRSEDRPNPLGLHPVSVRTIVGRRLLVGPLEAIDGTPVVDLKLDLVRDTSADGA